MSEETKLNYANSEFHKGNYVKALETYIELAECGNYGCARRIGYMYYSGFGVKKNDDEALRWLKISADLNDNYSNYLIGKIYLERGKTNEACDLFNKLVSVDYLPALYKLGAINLQKSDSLAKRYGLKILSQAMKRGHMAARRDLGVYYLKSGVNPLRKIVGIWCIATAVIQTFYIAIRDEYDERLLK